MVLVMRETWGFMDNDRTQHLESVGGIITEGEEPKGEYLRTLGSHVWRH